MPFTVKTISQKEHHVLNENGQKVAESPTREEAEASAKVLSESEANKKKK